MNRECLAIGSEKMSREYLAMLVNKWNDPSHIINPGAKWDLTLAHFDGIVKAGIACHVWMRIIALDNSSFAVKEFSTVDSDLSDWSVSHKCCLLPIFDDLVEKYKDYDSVSWKQEYGGNR